MSIAAPLAGAKRILVFCRFYLIDDFRANFAPFEGDARFEFAYLADGRATNTRDTRARFYRAYGDSVRSAALSPDDETEIVHRCRYLRNIDRGQALRQVHAMAVAINAEMDRFGPDAVISHMVDDYVTHVCSILAAKRGARFVGYAFSYFPAKIQLTQGWDGTPFEVRTPEDVEIEEVASAIGERVYRQNYLQPDSYSPLRHGGLVARNIAKRIVFRLRGLFERDPLNLHYTVTPYVADRSRLRDFPPANVFDNDWRAKLDAAQTAEPERLTIYLPLAFSPESTIDYWIADRSAIDYEALTLRMVSELAHHFTVIVKEHVHMQGIRDPGFYRRLGALGPVIQVPPQAFSNDALARCHVAVLGGGSVGVEATIRGIPVASYAPGSYWFEKSRALQLDLDRIDQWHAQLQEFARKHRPLDERERIDFIGQCLSSTVRPRPGQRTWPLIRTDDLEQILARA